MGHDFLFAADFGVVDEGAVFGVGREVAGCGVFEAFDDCGFAGAIVTDDEGERGVEGDCFLAGIVEGPDAQYGELVDFRHCGKYAYTG